MRIGIDIDDTITNSWEHLIPYYSKIFNISQNILYKSKPYYEAIKDRITKEEYFKIMKPVYDEVIPTAHLLPYVKETIDKLYDMGHKVYFITARGIDHTNAYQESKDYLDKYHIKYEKIYTGISNKADICLKEKINLFIDDSYRHCKEVSKIGIPVLMPTTIYNKEYTDFPRFDDWKMVYEYVRRLESGE